jgi:hypothetical protein
MVMQGGGHGLHPSETFTRYYGVSRTESPQEQLLILLLLLLLTIMIAFVWKQSLYLLATEHV